MEKMQFSLPSDGFFTFNVHNIYSFQSLSFSHWLAVCWAEFISESKQLPVPITLRQLVHNLGKRLCAGILGRDSKLWYLTINSANYTAGLPGTNNDHNQVHSH